MSKVYGIRKDFAYVRQDASRNIYGYGLEQVDDTHYIWGEVYFYKKQNPSPTIDDIKNAIIGDINAQTDERILSGFVWQNIPVWLSSENQFNFKAAYDLAIQTQGQSLPVKFKLGEDSQGEPIYHTFTDMAEFTDFYTKAITYINQCLNEGWEEKDSIDWSEYEPLLQQAANE